MAATAKKPAPPAARPGGTVPVEAQPKPPPAPETRPYALAGLKWTPKGYVVVIARFADDELQELTEYGPPEALKQYATTRLIRRIKHL